jgi:hypothetical protein
MAATERVVTDMDGLIILIVALAATVILDLLAQAQGADSRPDFNDPRSPARGWTT